MVSLSYETTKSYALKCSFILRKTVGLETRYPIAAYQWLDARFSPNCRFTLSYKGGRSDNRGVVTTWKCRRATHLCKRLSSLIRANLSRSAILAGLRAVKSLKHPSNCAVHSETGPLWQRTASTSAEVVCTALSSAVRTECIPRL